MEPRVPECRMHPRGGVPPFPFPGGPSGFIGAPPRSVVVATTNENAGLDFLGLQGEHPFLNLGIGK
jgi:hypothetical protein